MRKTGPGQRPISTREREAREEIKRGRAVEQAQKFYQELQSPEGSALIELISLQLEDRIKEMVAQDPECQGLVKILNKINVDLGMGRKITKKIVGYAGTIEGAR